MTFKDLQQQIKGKMLSPLYLLHGDESYFIDQVVNLFENQVLSETEQSFNQHIFYGKDAKATDIIDVCQRYPMFADRQVVLLKEANQMRDIDKLLPYIERPVPTTLLVIAYKNGKYDARKKMYKAIEKQGQIFISAKLYENQLAPFIEQQLKAKGLIPDSKSIRILADSIGNQLATIMNEIDKLAINLPAGTKLSPELIEKYIGISKEFNVFELQQSLLEKNLGKAIAIIHYMQADPKDNPIIVTLALLHTMYITLYKYLQTTPAKGGNSYNTHGIHPSSLDAYNKARSLYTKEEVEAIFGLLLVYDLRSKGVQRGETDDYGLLTELVFRICYGALQPV